MVRPLGGCEFATACRFRFASDRAKLGFVQIGMHIITGWGSGTRLMEKNRNQSWTNLTFNRRNVRCTTREGHWFY